MTTNSKIDRAALLQILQRRGDQPETPAHDRPTPSIAEAGQVAIEEQLRHIFAETLGLPPESVSSDLNFFEAGGDSLSVGQLLLALEAHLSEVAGHPVKTDPRLIYTTPVLSDLGLPPK